MTKEEKEKYAARKVAMIELQKNGATHQEIADKFGISKQRVSQILGKSKVSQFRYFSKERCVYPNLRKWLNDNFVSVYALIEKLGYERCPETCSNWSAKLRCNVGFTAINIHKLIKATGLTYEQLFDMEEGDCNS